jgi:hypothetical protein
MIRCSHGKSRMLRADGSYVRAFPNAGGRPSRNGVGFNVQEFFMDLAETQSFAISNGCVSAA